MSMKKQCLITEKTKTSMKRRDFFKTVGLTAVGIALNDVLILASQKPPRPNVLLIITDQQFADAMSCRMGDRYISTPAMDRLAADGMLFSRAYCANPICVPSRTAMLTGRYPHETGVLDNQIQWYKLDPLEVPTLGTLFKEAGYHTGYVGKWHVPYPSGDGESGFNTMRNLYHKGHDAQTPSVVKEFLKTPRRGTFLVVASFCNPHNICEWGRGTRGDDLPDGFVGELPAPEFCPPVKANHLPPMNETDIMQFIRTSYHNTKMMPIGDFDEDTWRQYLWAYYHMIQKVDSQIGEILDTLDELGLAEDTLIVFTSDHGDCQGAHKWSQKSMFYDEVSRVPLIIRQKGVTKGGCCDFLVETGVDLLPTLCDFTGIVPPGNLFGRSLKPIVTGETAPEDWREFVVSSNHLMYGAPVEGVTKRPHGRMVRSDRYKYCLYSEGERRESLIDMELDPGEMVNLAGSPEFADVLQQHRLRLHHFGERTGDQHALEMLSQVTE